MRPLKDEGSPAVETAGLASRANPEASFAQATCSEGPLELYSGAYQLASLFEGRHLSQYLLVGDSTVLFDTGIASTPPTTILPSLEKLGLEPSRIALAINSHPDVDHQGGNYALKQASPRTLLACGAADQEMIEDPQVLYDLRYNFLDADYGVCFDSTPSADAGKAQKVDLCFVGGERIRIRDDWQVEVLHVPGHSCGHLALYDGQHRAAFVGDAVHGRGCPKAAGGMALPVTYYSVDAYLSTLSLLEHLAIDTLFTAHWPPFRGGEIRDFLAESRQTVRTIDEVLLSSVRRNPQGLTMPELINAVGEEFSDWPRDTLVSAAFPIKGHMDRLEGLEKVRLVRDRRPFRWVLA
jgi:glyoxylase-like metal-dependent hydrolase (beta-lactamase superfamily II)